MAWVIGIDEAGYGPNLGPLVMTAVGCRVPDGNGLPDLWQTLAAVARRRADAGPEHLVVDDSKRVYSPSAGLDGLETSVLAALALPPSSLGEYVDRLCPDCGTEIRDEVWYGGTTPLPTTADVAGLDVKGQRFAEECVIAGVGFERTRGVVVCPRRFNELTDACDSKAAVLADALGELLRWSCSLNTTAEPLHFFIDKHGGRNAYSAMLQDALPEGTVVAMEESLTRSRYRVLGSSCDIAITFQPRADSEHFCVALASMASKYLRELLMLEFNQFWQKRIPNLRSTAGYPSDAGRYFDAIRPLLASLGIAEDAIWRRR